MRAPAGLLLAVTLLAAPGLHAQAPTVTLRSGDHPGYGRLVFDLPQGATARTVPAPDGVTVAAAGAAFGPVPRLPRNLRALDLGGGQATLHLVPGAGWRALRLPGRVVIDLLDPPSPAAVASVPGPAPKTAPPPPRRRLLWSGPVPRPYHPLPQSPPSAAPLPQAAAVPDAAPAAAPVPPVAQAPLMPPAGPVALAVGHDGHSLSLPFAAGTGAAAFRRGDVGMVVFDEPRPLDLAALHGDARFGEAQVQVLPAATVLRLKLAAAETLRLSRAAGGWTLTVLDGPAAPPLAPIRPEADAGRLRLAAAAPGQVVSVPDPATGGTLLVGTQRSAGEGMALERHAPDYVLFATVQGVAVEPLADADVLRAAPPGFVLEGGAGRPLAIPATDAAALAAADAARLIRRWDFPALPEPALLRRLQTALDDAANAPPQARAGRRLAAVQAELALGLDAEAESLARLAATDDARAAEAPDAGGLAAVAALLAGRDAEAGGIGDDRLSGSDEVAFWRAVRTAQAEEGAPAAAGVFAATLPLVLAYPAPLRDRLLPLVAETMAQGGEVAAAHRLLAARPDDPALDLARALLDEAEGHATPALDRLEHLAQSPDRWVRARAAVRAVELRLRLGSLTPAEAATALDRLLYSWRGDGRELALRLRVAALRAQAGAWRPALALLRETADGPVAQTWPKDVPAVRARLRTVFAAAMAADAATPLPPFELVALIDENPDLLPDGPPGAALAERLADRLAALDLPGRAAALLGKLVDGTAPGPARADLGARLAALQLDQGDATAALTTLSASAADGLDAALTERRTILFARATAARGAIGPAVAALVALGTPAATAARADILESAKDWPAAEAALADLAAQSVPASGALDETAAHLLLRLAGAAAQAGDEAMLARLRTDDLPRLPAGKLAAMLGVLTEQPVADVPDLPRAAQEAALARGLPADLNALGWTAAAPR
jgi:hypothetical protein